MVKSLQSHKIWFLFDNIGICWYNKLVIVRLYTTNKKRAQGENLDFLSFLTQAADYLVGFAKTFAGLSVALIIFMLARCLPKRIRRYFSACATLVITFALFRDSVQQFTFFTIKASVVNFTIAYLTALTFLFFVYVAIYIADADVVRYFVNARRNVKCDSRFVKGYALHNDGISASASYLRISPVCLQ